MRRMANEDLRVYAAKKNVFLWEVAEGFGYEDHQFSRLLRRELSDENKKSFKELVDAISEGRKETRAFRLKRVYRGSLYHTRQDGEGMEDEK